MHSKQTDLRVTAMGCSLPWSLFLLGFFTGPGASREDRDTIVVVGVLDGSVTLPLQLPHGQEVERISWRSRSGNITTVTLGETGSLDTLQQTNSRYQNRLRLVGPGSSLQISNLSRKDAGAYRARIFLRNSPDTHIKKYSLKVYELLTQPHITLSSRVSENGQCITILTCAAEGGGDPVTYSWTPLGPRTVVSQNGSVLSVSSRPGDDVLTFTCVAKNPASNSSSLPVSVPPSCPGSGVLEGDTVGQTVIGTLGESVTLTLDVPVGEEVENVTWSSRGRLLTVLQPGRAGKPILVTGTRGPYGGRLSAIHHGYSLQISPLRLQDSGPYRASVTLRNSPRDITKDLTLRVYEKLQAPNITASPLIMKDGTCSLTLVCSLQQAAEDVQYTWEPHGHGAVVSHGGTTLTVSWRPGSSDSFCCTTRNPVSQSSRSVLARPLCSDSFLTCSPKKAFLLFLILGVLEFE